MTRSTLTRKKGFTLIELLVVISIIALLIAILLPALGAARRTARRMQNSTQVRGIHQALVTHSNSNKNYFAGLLSSGKEAPNDASNTGLAGTGFEVEARYWVLLDGNFFTPEYAISPSETDSTVQAWNPPTATLTATNTVQSTNYSYAMPEISTSNTQRKTEWSGTLNSQAPAVTDRALTNATDPDSIHTESGSKDWKGSVAWNDNHVGFENAEDSFTTKLGSGALNDENDDLFVAAGTDDALMVAEGTNTVVRSTP